MGNVEIPWRQIAEIILDFEVGIFQDVVGTEFSRNDISNGAARRDVLSSLKNVYLYWLRLGFRKRRTRKSSEGRIKMTPHKNTQRTDTKAHLSTISEPAPAYEVGNILTEYLSGAPQIKGNNKIIVCFFPGLDKIPLQKLITAWMTALLIYYTRQYEPYYYFFHPASIFRGV